MTSEGRLNVNLYLARLFALAVIAASCTQPSRAPEDRPVVSGSAGTTSDIPEDVARVRLNALIRGDHLDFARRTDPSELRRTRVAFDSLIRADTVNYLAQRLFDLKTTAQLLQLEDVEFTARLLRFQQKLRGAENYFAAVRGVDIIGTVRKGVDTAHVVYRWQFPADSLPLRSYQVETLVRCPTGWCGHMAGDYRGLIDLLKQPMVEVPNRR